MRDERATASVQMRRGSGSLLGRNNSAAACHVGWFVDGQRLDRPGADPLTEGLALMRLDDVEAIEVFRGISEMPPEFAAPELRCGAVALWMKHG